MAGRNEVEEAELQEPRSSGPWRAVRDHPRLAWTLLFVVVAAFITLRDYQGSLDPADWHYRGDFSLHTLAASRVVAEGGNPYGEEGVEGLAYRYFPLNALVYIPFTWVPVPVAQGLWFAGNLVLLLLALSRHSDLARRRVGPWPWVLALLVSGRFINDCFKLGQWNLPVYSLTVLGLWLTIARRRAWAGGLLVGLAAGLKYMPLLFALYFLAKRQVRAAAAIVIAMTFWVLVFPTLMLGYERHSELFHAFVEQGTADVQSMVGDDLLVGSSLLVTTQAYLTPVKKHSSHGLRMTINVLDLPPATARGIALAVCALLAAAALIVLWRTGPGPGIGPQAVLELGLVFLLLLLISPEVRKAQLLTTFTPTFALALHCMKPDVARTGARLPLAAILGAWALVLVSSKIIGDSALRRYAVSYGSLTLALLLLFGASLTLLLRAHRPAPSTGGEPDRGAPG